MLWVTGNVSCKNFKKIFVKGHVSNLGSDLFRIESYLYSKDVFPYSFSGSLADFAGHLSDRVL